MLPVDSAARHVTAPPWHGDPSAGQSSQPDPMPAPRLRHPDDHLRWKKRQDAFLTFPRPMEFKAYTEQLLRVSQDEALACLHIPTVMETSCSLRWSIIQWVLPSFSRYYFQSTMQLAKYCKKALAEKIICQEIGFPLLHLTHSSKFQLHCFLPALNLMKHVVSLTRTCRCQMLTIISANSCYCSHINR